MNTAFFEQHRDRIAQLDLSSLQAWPESLKMREDGAWTTYYAPFEHVNRSAKLVILGITPGLTQALNALRSAQASIREGLPSEDALARAKVFASFSGPMRSNLVALLDQVGAARWLGVSTTAELFGTHSSLVQFSSALRFPVALNGENYSGTPGIVETRFTREELERSLVREVELLPDAVYVPLGPAVTEALEWVCRNGGLDRNHVLAGLPHPSGANAERIAYFLGRKARASLSSKVNPDRLDACRSALQAKMESIKLRTDGRRPS